MLRFIANLKILKAIHNDLYEEDQDRSVAIYRKFKNFESNSQHNPSSDSKIVGCDLSQI